LITAGGRLVGAPVVGSPTATVSSISPNLAFIAGSVLYPADAPFLAPPPAGFSNVAGLFEVAAATVSPGAPPDTIFIGTFELTVTGAAGDVLRIRSALLGDLGFSANIGGLGADIDTIIFMDPRLGQFASVDITILQDSQVIPEPGSLLLWGGIAGTATVLHLRRRGGKRMAA
jgi:hypothetical protein